MENSFFQQFVDAFDIVEAVVDKEAQFRDDAQLVSDTCAQLISDLFVAGIDVLQDLLTLLTGEDGEVGRADAVISSYALQRPSYRG